MLPALLLNTMTPKDLSNFKIWWFCESISHREESSIECILWNIINYSKDLLDIKFLLVYFCKLENIMWRVDDSAVVQNRKKSFPDNMKTRNKGEKKSLKSMFICSHQLACPRNFTHLQRCWCVCHCCFVSNDFAIIL